MLELDNNINSLELDFTLRNTNPINAMYYKIAYALLREYDSNYIDSRLNHLISQVDRMESDTINIMISTIYLEVFRKYFKDMGVEVSIDIILFEAISLCQALLEIIRSDDLVDYLRSIPLSDCDIYILSYNLDNSLIEYSDLLISADGFIEKLYADNIEYINRDMMEPLELPSVI